MGFPFQLHTICIPTTLERWNKPSEKKPWQHLGSGGFHIATAINHNIEMAAVYAAGPVCTLVSSDCNLEFDQMTQILNPS